MRVFPRFPENWRSSSGMTGRAMMLRTQGEFTVVGLLAATACAVAIFFVPAQKLWKPRQLPRRSG